MKYFKMGEKVTVHATMYPLYVDEERLWLRKVLLPPKEAFYVGYAHKHEGKAGYDRYSQPKLVDIKAIKLLRVKFSDHSNDYFALLQDVRRIR